MVIGMKFAKKSAALILVLSMALGLAGCKKEKPQEKEPAWYDAKSVDIRLPYNESEYNSLNSSFVGIVRNIAVVHVNYSKPYPNDFDYGLDDPSPYQGDTLEIYDLAGNHLLTYDCSKFAPSFNGQMSMSSEPAVTGGKVLIPWEIYNEAGGSKSIIEIVDPSNGNLVSTYEQKLTGKYLRPGFVSSGGYYAFSYSSYEKSDSIEMVIVDEGGNARTINITDTEIIWNNNFPMVEQGDGKILMPYMKKNMPTWNISGYYLIDLKAGTYEKKDDIGQIFNTTNIYNTSYIEGLGITVANEDGLSSADLENKTTERLINYDKCNANLFVISRLKLYSAEENRFVFGGNVLMEQYQQAVNTSKIIVLEKAEKNPNEGKKELKLASFDPLDYTTAEAVCKFNIESSDYFITFDSRYNLKNFRDADSVDWITANLMAQRSMFDQLKVDIFAGEGPDIIMNGADFSTSFEPALFMDLTEDIGSEGIFENVIEVNKTDGKLYTVPLTFTLSGIICDSAFIRERQKGFTCKEYEQFVRSVCNGNDPVKKNKADYFLFCYSLMPDCQVYAGETPDFGNEKFKKLAKFVYMTVENKPTDETTDPVNSLGDDIHATSYTFSSTNAYFSFGMSHDADTVVLGYPSDEETGPYVSIVNSVAVANTTKNKAGCVEFVKLLMSSETQADYAKTGFSIPVNVEAFGDSSKAQLKQYNAERKKYIEMGFSEADLRNFGTLSEARERDITAFENIIRSAETVYRYDPAVALIIKEEMQAYFSGQKNLDDVVLIINNRAKTYLSERGS